MLPGVLSLLPAASPTISEPTPTSLASRLISAAPLQAGCGGDGEDRLVDHVLPAAGEHAAARDAHRRHHADAAEARHQHRIALLEVGGLADRQRLDLERLEGAQQPEAGLVIVADHAGRHGAAGVGDHLGGVRLDHQIADGEHQAVLVDQDAAAFALAAEVARPSGRRD